MASQKQARSASGRSSSGAAAQAGSGSSTGGGNRGRGQNTGGKNTQARGGTARSGQQNGRSRDGQGRSGQGRSGRSQGGQAANTQAGQGRPTATQPRLSTQAAVSPASRAAAPAVRRVPLWFQITTLVLSLGGLGVSIYLTIAHYTSSSILACSNSGVVNCAKVTTSAESVVFGIFPVAVLGLAFYVFMTAINTPWAWRAPLPWIAWLRTAAIISGICFVLYLIYAEVIEIGNICLWCTTVHIITFVLFVLLMSVAPFGGKARAARATLA